jgi:hypothetical protein
MTISQYAALNTTALVVPDLYVQIVPPSILSLNGVPTNVVGMVGLASWGPVNQAVPIGTMAQYAAAFGPIINRTYDMGTHVAIAVQQGASSFECVRVTDTTDVAATSTGIATCISFAALYTGTLGNSISVSIVSGSKAGTFGVTVGIPGLTSERFDNISGTGNAFWIALAAAINTGAGQVRGPSVYIRATAGAGTTAAAVSGPYVLTGGTDGATTITAAVLVGSNSTPRTGMYQLANQGVSILDLCDASDSTQWTTIDGFALANGMYAIQVGPSGDTIANAVTTKATAGLDDYSSKLLFGDWLWWNDQTNGVQRLVSPQAFAAGRLANLAPNQSSLNKQLYGIIGSQKVGAPSSPAANAYSNAELQTLFQVGIDLITNPGAGNQSFWTARLGHNSSSNAAVSGDNYTRMTNYIAATLDAGMGLFIGDVITTELFFDIRSTLLAFFAGLLGQGLLDATYGTPYAVKCDATNNPQSRTALGYVQADCQVQYEGITEKFIVNLQGGTTVTVTSASQQAAA